MFIFNDNEIGVVQNKTGNIIVLERAHLPLWILSIVFMIDENEIPFSRSNVTKNGK